MSRATNQLIGAGISQGLQNFANVYVARKDKELAEQRAKEKREQQFAALNDPKISLAEKALIVSEYSPVESAKLIKEGLRNQTEQQFWESKLAPMLQQAPRGMNLVQAMQSGMIPGMAVNQLSPEMQAPTPFQTEPSIQAQAQPSPAPGQNPLTMLADEDLIEGIGRLPHRSQMFKAEIDRRRALNRQQSPREQIAPQQLFTNIIKKTLGNNPTDKAITRAEEILELGGPLLEKGVSPVAAYNQARRIVTEKEDARKVLQKQVLGPAKFGSTKHLKNDILKVKKLKNILSEDEITSSLLEKGYSPEDLVQFGIGGEMTEPSPTVAQSKRVRWNPQDPKHQQRALELLQQAKGDRSIANQALAQEFER